MFCKKCGNEVGNEAVYCGKCGYNINGKVIEENEKTQSAQVFGTFRGRLDRKNFTKYFFLYIFLSFFPFLIAPLFSLSSDQEGFLGGLFMIVILIAFALFICTLIRRMHDINKSGFKLLWAILAFFIPLLWIWYLIVIFQKGDSGNNKYGAMPSYDGFWQAILNFK